MAKTVSFNARFEILNAAKQATNRQDTVDTSAIVSQVTTKSPQLLAGNLVKYQVNMDGVTLAKRMFIRTSQEVTLILSNVLDAGFKFGPGDGYFPSTSGITGCWVSTGPNVTELEAIFAGD